MDFTLSAEPMILSDISHLVTLSVFNRSTFTRLEIDNPPFVHIQYSEMDVNDSLEMTNRGKFTNHHQRMLIWRQGGKNLMDVARKVYEKYYALLGVLRNSASRNRTSTNYILGLREIDPWKLVNSLNYEQQQLRVVAEKQLDYYATGGTSPMFLLSECRVAINTIMKAYIDDRFQDYRDGNLYTIGIPDGMVSKFRSDQNTTAGLLEIHINANRLFSD